MALNELTVAEKLKQLYNLQLIDSEIDEISILRGELPMEVSDLEDEIAGLETRKGRLQNNIETMEADLAKHKTNIKEAESLISKYEKQMDNVKNNREYDALSKELEMQRLEIQLSEKSSPEPITPTQSLQLHKHPHASRCCGHLCHLFAPVRVLRESEGMGSKQPDHLQQ